MISSQHHPAKPIHSGHAWSKLLVCAQNDNRRHYNVSTSANGINDFQQFVLALTVTDEVSSAHTIHSVDIYQVILPRLKAIYQDYQVRVIKTHLLSRVKPV